MVFFLQSDLVYGFNDFQWLFFGPIKDASKPSMDEKSYSLSFSSKGTLFLSFSTASAKGENANSTGKKNQNFNKQNVFSF